MKFPCLVLVWVGSFPSRPSFQGTDRAIILVSSFFTKVKFSRAFGRSSGTSVGQGAWALGQGWRGGLTADGLKNLFPTRTPSQARSSPEPSAPPLFSPSRSSRNYLWIIQVASRPVPGRNAGLCQLIFWDHKKGNKQEVSYGLESESGCSTKS